MLLVQSEEPSRERARRLAAMVVDLKRSEEEARQASRAKSEFLANMSHEIRTPMNAVLGMTTVLGGTGLNQEQREYVETIRTSGESLLALVNDLLDISKIEAGMLQTESLPFDLRPCLDEAVDLLATSAARKGLEIGCLVEDGVPVRVRTDAARLRQILVNLLSNAVKFTQRGEVFLTAAARAPESGEGMELELAVRDTGIGIPADRIHRLFRPFSQVDSSTTRLYGGTGLGLAISRRLTAMLGGTMTVESEPERGSVFRFTVRCTAEAAPPQPELEIRPPHLAGRRLLFATAKPQPARIVGWYAGRWGMPMAAAASAEEALDGIVSGSPDLVLVDGEMEGAERIAAACGAAELPWVSLLPGGAGAGRASEPGPPALTRPIKGPLLYAAFLDALGHDLPRAAREDAGATPGTSLEPPGLRILVAEDNPVNQKVLLLLLSGLGYAADLAADGLEVLAALRRQPYDVILMDVHMPEMDGLEVARRIRRNLPAQDQPRIIAVTASALQEDREACIAAGMDAYLSKPISLDDLRSILRQDPAPQPRPRAGSAPAALDSLPVLEDAALDRLRALERHAGRPVLKPIVESFLARAPRDLTEMRDTLSRKDWSRLAFQAHSLKGNALQLGAHRLTARLQELEREAREDGRRELGEEFLRQVEGEFQRVADVMEGVLAG
jgi:CheY-like chemotaxis protein/nitrogen-specific signal transduction histidine kinase